MSAAYCVNIAICYNSGMYKITYRKKAAKTLEKMPASLARTFHAAFCQLASGIADGLDIKKLEGRAGFRLRVGDYRALYRIIDNMMVIEVVKIGSRGDVYK